MARSYCHLQLGNSDKALQDALKTLSDDPNYIKVYVDYLCAKIVNTIVIAKLSLLFSQCSYWKTNMFAVILGYIKAGRSLLSERAV